MKYLIEVLNIKDYDFQGQININGFSHHIEGEFNVNWDHEIAMVEIQSIDMRLGTNWISINLDNIDNLDQVELEISETDNQDWYADRQADLCDYYYDMLRDR